VKMNRVTHLAHGAVFLLLILVVSSCGRQNGSQEEDGSLQEERAQRSADQPILTFDTLVYDFGTIIEGEQVVCYFDYRNGGGEELLIKSVDATCGCTTPQWNREPLGPGEKESLEVIFDASGRSGVQRKVVTVTSNATNQVVRLTIRANVNNSV
jgi:hypothetical protein